MAWSRTLPRQPESPELAREMLMGGRPPPPARGRVCGLMLACRRLVAFEFVRRRDAVRIIVFMALASSNLTCVNERHCNGLYASQVLSAARPRIVFVQKCLMLRTAEWCASPVGNQEIRFTGTQEARLRKHHPLADVETSLPEKRYVDCYGSLPRAAERNQLPGIATAK